MTSEAPDVNWQDILEKFYSYDGIIVDFCKQNNIKPHQLYYQRKRANRSDTPKFHAINLKENLLNKASNQKTILPKSNLVSDIKIEIGKATIQIKLLLKVAEHDYIITFGQMKINLGF